jgi:hypothetical protein
MGGDRENESTTSSTGHEKIKTTNTGIECHDPIWLICGLCTSVYHDKRLCIKLHKLFL